GPANFAAGQLQPFKGLRCRNLVDQVKVDIDQAGPVILTVDDVVFPDLVEEGAGCGHGSPHSGCKLSPWPAAAPAGSGSRCALLRLRAPSGRTLSRARSAMRARLPVRPRR